MQTRAPQMEELKLSRYSTVRGTVRLPGSKSIANRALLLSALARGSTRLWNLPEAEDIAALRAALPQLGVALESHEEQGREVLTVQGCNGPFPAPAAHLNLENAGTALRPLVAALAASRGDYVIDGNEQMRRRPIRDLTDGLMRLGVDVAPAENGCPPVRLVARGLPGGETELSGTVSSQFVSALLMAAPLARSPIRLRLPEEPVSKPYIDLTIAMMAEFGASVTMDGYRSYYVEAPQTYVSPGEYSVEGDATAATYFLGAGALPGSGPVRVLGLGGKSRQGDLGFIEILRRLGASVAVGDDWLEARGPAAGTRLNAIDVDMNDMPDAAMTLAVLALFAQGTTRIRNIANLRVKESERIRGLRLELEKLGAQVEEGADYLYITAPDSLRPAAIETYRDHRMAMAFALAAYGVDLTILDPACVGKTYVRFFDDFLPLTQ